MSEAINDNLQTAILVAIGNDRTGLVRDVAQAVSAAEIQLIDIRSEQLGGKFTFLSRIAGTPASVNDLKRDVRGWKQELGINAQVYTDHPIPPVAESMASFRLSITSIDSCGLVHEVASALSKIGANFRNLEAVTAYYPNSPVYFVIETILEIDSELVTDLYSGLDSLPEIIDYRLEKI